MRNNQFLEQDNKKVIAEHRAAMACLSRSEHALMLGDLKKAERYAIDYIKSVRELTRLEQRKVDREKLVEVTERLKSQGVLSAIVMKI
ncbi:hypothetical protein NST77_23050 [Niallia sp. FSL W8-0177]|uniref:hypothetical protein n=1 Tax=Niallia TaxID=2837506 RepID=UPI002E1BE37B|nr:hypothetical protein [Niallia circulans]